ncbi:MAG: hypothetical protein ROY82_02785 [Truepera sp.]|nr:hypothetical protein [Truepera sp.]
MRLSHRNWSRALGLATALVVADVLGFALVGLVRTLPAGSLPEFIHGDVGHVVVYAAVVLLVLTGANQLFGERWRLLLVVAVLLGSRYLSLDIAGEYPSDLSGEGSLTVFPFALLYGFVGWTLAPLAVGWWTVRANRLARLDLTLLVTSAAVLALVFLA